jgi:hypothetical protein
MLIAVQSASEIADEEFLSPLTVSTSIGFTSLQSAVVRRRAVQRPAAAGSSRRELVNDMVAAVNIKGLAGDEARGVMGEECGGNADVIDADAVPGPSRVDDRVTIDILDAGHDALLELLF